MDETLEKVLHAMPCEYKDSFLQYNLLQRHISLDVNGACQCSVKREFEEACSPFGDLEAAAVLCSFRALPARYGPCSYCGLPKQGGPTRLDLRLQISEFERFLDKELEKINNLFNLLHRQYIGRMKELDDMTSKVVSRQNRRPSEDREFGIELEKIRQCMETTAAKIDLLASYCTLNREAFIQILKKHDEETGSNIRRRFSVRLKQMDFVRYLPAVKHDAKCRLSLLGSSTASSSSVTPPMSSRAKKVCLSLQQKRLQFLSSSDGNFNYIEAAKAAKDVIAAWSPKL